MKVGLLGTRFTLEFKKKIKYTIFPPKKLDLRQPNTVTTERQKMSEVNFIIALVYCLERESRSWGRAGKTKWKPGNALSWGVKAVRSQERVLESRQTHKERILAICKGLPKSIQMNTVWCMNMRKLGWRKFIQRDYGSHHTKNCVSS